MILIKVKINRSKRDLKILLFDHTSLKTGFEENINSSFPHEEGVPETKVSPVLNAETFDDAAKKPRRFYTCNGSNTFN